MRRQRQPSRSDGRSKAGKDIEPGTGKMQQFNQVFFLFGTAVGTI
jgi:hypothetical protein